MRLCRFQLTESPEQVRSGIFHENRVYETDGRNAIGVHDLGRLALLPPVGLPPTLRMFEPGGEGEWVYRYANPTGMLGPMGEAEAAGREMDFEARLAAVVRDEGARVGRDEAADFILGYSILVEFRADAGQEDGVYGRIRSADLPVGLGPFLTTPEELVDFAADGGDPTRLKSALTVRVNGEDLGRDEFQSPIGFAEMIERATAGIALVSGDLLAGPPLPRSRLRETRLGRGLLPGDTLQVGIEPFGMLTLKVV